MPAARTKGSSGAIRSRITAAVDSACDRIGCLFQVSTSTSAKEAGSSSYASSTGRIPASTLSAGPVECIAK
jgi:hypothetical protein